MKATKVFTYTEETADGDEVEVEIKLPITMEVCSDCEGHGSVLNASMRHHAYTQEEFNETFWDPEDREAYMTPGSHYHVTCPTCHGKNVVAVVDEPNLTEKQKTVWEMLRKMEEDAAREDAADAHTRRMESGGYG